MKNEIHNPAFFDRLAESRRGQIGVEMRERDFLHALAARHLQLIARDRPDEAADYLEVDAARFVDPAVFAREQDLIFARTPLIAGLSQDIPEAGDFLQLEHTEVPIVIVRGRDGTARAFVNACRHRGAALVYEPRGAFPLRITCPYHAWAYDLDGRLVGQPCQSAFAGLDKSDYGLLPIACEERHGIIFVAPGPNRALDLDAHLGPDLDRELAYWNYDRLEATHSGLMELEGNWKLAFDTFCEFYHFAYAHKNNMAHFYNGNINTVDTRERHLRISVSLKSIAAELEQIAPAERRPENYVHVTYLLFPGIILINTQHVMELFRIFPKSVDKTVVQHSCYSRLPLAEPENAALIDTIWKTAHHIVQDEDFRFGVTGVHRAMKSGALQKLVFGRNELAGQLMHANIQAALATPTA